LQEKIKGLFMYLLTIAAIFALAVYLIRLAFCWLSQIWWIIMLIAALVIAGIFIWRWWKNKYGEW